MSALAADKSPVCDGSHWLKLVARDAVRAPNYGRDHRYVQQEPRFRSKVPPAGILPVDDCKNVKSRSCDAPGV
jgi:hypothetical protein